ncbi:MAG: hypothetical protein GX900_01080 [Clostridiaceae bacterium]|nr:hypothetical protein [Clostridiaceae bacterium]
MKIEITYPEPPRVSRWFELLRKVARWIFGFALVIAPGINILLGGKPWSLVVLWAMWTTWNVLLSPDIVEFNPISQIVKSLIHIVILLGLIDVLLAPGWASFVIPIVAAAALVAALIFFLTDVRQHQHNMMPLIWLTLYSSIAFLVVFFAEISMDWPMIALGVVAWTLIGVGIVAFHKYLRIEFAKRFHWK